MKAFGVTVIVLAFLAATFAEDAGWVELSKNDANGWELTAALGLVYAAWWFASGDDK